MLDYQGETVYIFSVDWTSYGVLCYEMITGQSPFGGEDEEELFDPICNSKIPYSRYLEQSILLISLIR